MRLGFSSSCKGAAACCQLQAHPLCSFQSMTAHGLFVTETAACTGDMITVMVQLKEYLLAALLRQISA